MRFHALVLCLLLDGCSMLPPSAEEQPRPARDSIATFAIDGRIAIHQGERNYVSGISWRHAMEHDEMQLTTPLGQGIAELVRDGSGARLTLADRRKISAADLEGLAEQAFGITLPLSALPRWLVADIPAGAQQITRDAAGRPQQLHVDGWRIDYRDYESAQASALPILIKLHREAAGASEQIDIRLKIDEWTLPD